MTLFWPLKKLFFGRCQFVNVVFNLHTITFVHCADLRKNSFVLALLTTIFIEKTVFLFSSFY